MQFNIHRFYLLMRKQLSENMRVYLMALAALGFFWVILLTLILSQGSGIDSQMEIFTIGFVFTGMLLAYHQFKVLSNVPQSIRFLHLPASHLEKILLAVVLTLVIFPSLAVLVFYAVEIPIVEGFRKQFARLPEVQKNLKILPINMLKEPLKTIFFFLPFMVLGGIYFKKNALIKTALLVMGLLIGVEILNMQLIKWLIDAPENTTLSGSFFESLFVNNTENFEQDILKLPKNLSYCLNIFTWYLTPVFFWVLAWFRLKETEVA